MNIQVLISTQTTRKKINITKRKNKVNDGMSETKRKTAPNNGLNLNEV